jgi:putative ABC transport system permease protein
VRALGGIVADSVANRRFEMNVLLLFAVSALLLAGLGVYGVLTYSVSQRHREIGLRLALGAQRAERILAGAPRRTATGCNRRSCWNCCRIRIGARLVSGLLYQISPYDPILSAGAVGVLLAVGATACLLPARHATAVDPMRVLRTEQTIAPRIWLTPTSTGAKSPTCVLRPRTRGRVHRNERVK